MRARAVAKMSSNPVVVAAVLVVLLTLTAVVARRVGDAEGDPLLPRLIMVSACLRFACTFAQVYLVRHYYAGLADFNLYDAQGAHIASLLHHGSFTLGSGGISGNGMVSLAAGLVFAVIGANQIGGFLIFAWVALLGTIAFYRAFRIAVPTFDSSRYAILVFLMPSLLFWTAAIGKEALMTAFLGLSTNGAARFFAHQRGALTRSAAGLTLATVLRPNESVILFGALAIAFLVVRARHPGRAGPLGVLAWAAVLAAGGFVIVDVAVHFLHLRNFSLQAINNQLRSQDARNAGQGLGLRSSNYKYSPGFSHYFRDAYTVLLDPLPVQAHGTTQLLASLENVIVLGILLVSLPRLARSARAALREPYVLLCLVYSLTGLYLFASLGNLGLIDRERTLLFPYLFVLLCSPRKQAPVQAEPKQGSGSPVGQSWAPSPRQSVLGELGT